MKIFLLSLTGLMLICGSAWAAAPDDVQLSQRLWLDGLDVDADGSTANNPANSAQVTTWTDKSANAFVAGIATSYAPSNREFPVYSTGNGVVFDGLRDVLEVTGGIYGSGTSVTASDIYAVTTTASTKQSFLFYAGPASSVQNRIGVHAPWSDNNIYWDQPCCAAGRLTASWTAASSVYNRRYLWEFRAQLATEQTIFRSAGVLSTQATSGSYTQNAADHFYIGSGAGVPTLTHDGVISEFIVYQRRLNLAEKTLVSNYLQSKWNVPDALGTVDRYAGDSGANGDYDFYVGGIGQESDGSVTTGTSAGLSIQNDTLLNANGDYLIAGVDNLIPATGTSVADLPTNVSSRSQRIWHMDVSNAGTAGGNVNLLINPAGIGMPGSVGEVYVLLYRAGTSGTFATLNSATVGVGGSITIALNNPADGYYALGRILPLLNVTKTASVANANPGDTIGYQVVVANTQQGAASNVVLVDDMSEFSALRLDTYGAGVHFQCSTGCPGSGVTLGTPVYSNDDGATFTYTPVSGGGGAPAGYDANITDWRIPMTGIQSAAPASFTVIYEARVN